MYDTIPIIPLYIPGYSPDRNKNVFNLPEKMYMNTKLPIIESKKKSPVKTNKIKLSKLDKSKDTFRT